MYRQLGLEGLESRITPAGNVFALVRGDDLVLLGDAQDNQVEIASTQDGDIAVMGLGDTTINGKQIEVVFTNTSTLPDDLWAVLGRGDDQLQLNEVNIDDDVTIFSQFGDDAVALTNTSVGDDLRLHTGFGNDTVVLQSTVVKDQTRVRTGTGDDRIDLIGTNEFQDRTILNGGRGEDRLLKDQANDFAGPLRIRQIEETVVRVTFDNQANGTNEVTFDGGNLTGGQVLSLGILSFYATPPRAYIVGDGGTATISFDVPVESVQFFFVDGSQLDFEGNPVTLPATATAYDSEGKVVDTVTSNPATELGDPANFVTLEGSNKIATIVIEGGLLDNLRFTQPSP